MVHGSSKSSLSTKHHKLESIHIEKIDFVWVSVSLASAQCSEEGFNSDFNQLSDKGTKQIWQLRMNCDFQLWKILDHIISLKCPNQSSLPRKWFLQANGKRKRDTILRLTHSYSIQWCKMHENNTRRSPPTLQFGGGWGSFLRPIKMNVLRMLWASEKWVYNANVHEVIDMHIVSKRTLQNWKIYLSLTGRCILTNPEHSQKMNAHNDVWVLVFILLICVECWWLAGKERWVTY